MRNAILALVAVAATVSFAAPSFAGGHYYGSNDGYYGHGRHGHVRVYDDYDYRPSCRIKKIRKYDYDGNVYFKKVRICR